VHSRAWLITHIAPPRLAIDYSSIRPDDLVIAVDGGLKQCLQLSLSPQVVIGDFDSIEPAHLLKLSPDCERITHPADKDETDTQLALEYCLARNIGEIIICNDLSGRFDHSLALVQNLLQAHRQGASAKAVSASQVMFLFEGSTTLSYPINSLLSLISLTKSSEFSSSQGLAYPMDNLTLYNWHSRGISNEISETTQSIFCASGLVLAIITLQHHL